MKPAHFVSLSLALALSSAPGPAAPAQGPKAVKPVVSFLNAKAAPARQADEGSGPFRKFVIRGATLIDGSGAPPRGPVDIVIEGDRITEILSAGTPRLPLKDQRAPRDADFELDATGMYVLPGFIDMHVHGSTVDKAPTLEYSYKLWLAHGITSVRGVPLAQYDVAMSEKARSERNEIVAPRIFNYQLPGEGWPGGQIQNAEQGRAWVRWAAQHGVDGIKLHGAPAQPPPVMRAILDEAKKQGLGTVAHLAQIGVAQMNAQQAGEAGLGTVTHFYGHFESLLKDRAVQTWQPDYNYNDEQDRFGDVANLWEQSVEPGSPKWQAYLEDQKAHHVTFDPTMTIYAAGRSLSLARNADWHDTYTMPQLWNYFKSSREHHGSYFYDWTTRREVQWRHFYQKFMALLNDYKNMGGRVTTGTDSGFIYKTYGFGFPEELEMLQEAGFDPLEVIQSATINGARTIYDPKGNDDPPMGIVAVGKLADLVIVKENPLQNLKTLYANGFLRLNEQTQKQERVGGVSYTIKGGIVYDAKKLLADVAAMVASEKRRMGLPEHGLPRD